MAVKKPSLRAKAAQKSGPSKARTYSAEVSSSYHENPMLKLSKTSKKEKQRNKSESFSQKLQRSAIKGVTKAEHKKRRTELRPDMSELLQTLPETSVNFVTKSEAMNWPSVESGTYVQDKKKAQANKPNPQKHTGHQQILRAESERFKKVLTNESFKASPFATLKSVIEANMNRGNTRE